LPRPRRGDRRIYQLEDLRPSGLLNLDRFHKAKGYAKGLEAWS